MNEDAINSAIEDTVVGIYDTSDESQDIGIVLEGVRVLRDLENVALAVAMLFGLLYALNLSYPAGLRYTFEVVQKILIDMDGGKLPNKVLALKNSISMDLHLLICTYSLLLIYRVPLCAF
uniref:Uncharacterized protein n=1 Tax=Labrus bergylta TaxID=56723 RepID=A0A3Q3E368_9LABR